METITYSNARAKLAKTIDRICRDHAPVIITRQRGENAVLLSLEDYDSLEETAYLLRSPKNARRLIKSIDELGSGRGKKRKLKI